MSRAARLSLVCLACFTAAACSQPPPPPPPALTVTSDKSELTADGAATATISVSGATTAVRVTATKGTWQDSGKSVTNLTGDGSVTLVACDSRTDATCSGPVKVNATATNGAIGSVIITFKGLESCSNGTDDDGDGQADCADTDCLNATCALTTGSTGVCTAAGTCQCETGAAEVCDDGMDNNCDGKADCEDASCDGQVCTMGTGFSGRCKSSACSCPGTAEVCNNGIDDDCNGKTDCEDAPCQPVGNNLGKVCDARGNTCAPAVNGTSTCSICSGNGKEAQTPERSCFDNADNDCDGQSDCQDPDCGGLLCSTAGKLCDGATHTCVCPGGQVETTCDDFVDNDCDGKADCGDSDCQNALSPKACKIQGKPSAGTVCTLAGMCVCQGNGGAPETTEGATSGSATCGDGFDNDCDGLTDCLDPDCRPTTTGLGKDCSQPTGMPITVGMKCDASGTCICSGNGGNPESQEASCNDGKDNDCDGKVDCLDPNCAGLTCAANGKTCSTNGCACPGGTSETCTNFKDDNCDGLIDCADPQCPVGTGCSTASANYQCTGAKECKDVTSTYSLTLTATPTRLAANGTSTASVAATLKNGTTPVGGATVTFAVTGGAGTVTASSITNAQGVATAVYTAGTLGTANTITGSYDTGTQIINGSAVVDTPALGQVLLVGSQTQVMGVKFSGNNQAPETNDITFKLTDAAGQAYPPGLPVTFTHQPVGGSYIGTTANCTTLVCTATGVTDATGQTKVTLHSGTVASVVSVTATATAGGVTSMATASNIAIVGAKPSGAHISITCTPFNVPGFVTNDCLNSQVNATINCTAAFADRFNNILGVQTVSTFKTEAAASNATATTDPKTGLAKVAVSVLGYSLPVDVAPLASEYSLSYDSGCGVKVHNPRDGLVSILVVANGEEGFIDGSNGQPADGVYNAGENFIDIAEPFVDSNDNGTRDNGEDYVDSNTNGQWDGPNGVWDTNTRIWAETRVLYSGLAAIAANTSGQYEISRWFDQGVPPTSGATLPPSFAVNCKNPATTANLGVYYADKNFNRLVAGTTFAVSTVSGGVQASFTQTPASVDTLGMNFAQQFCQTQSGTNCSTTCQHAPCYVVSSVSGFSYGNYGTVAIKGGGTSMTNEVRSNATFSGITTPMSVYGLCQDL